MATSPEKLSFGYCDETCPAVNRVVNDFVSGELERFIERVKEVSSYKLREALVSACEDLQQAETNIEELNAEIDKKDEVIAALESEIRELRALVSEDI